MSGGILLTVVPTVRDQTLRTASGMIAENYPRLTAGTAQAMANGATGDIRCGLIGLNAGDIITNLHCVCQATAATVTTLKMAIYAGGALGASISRLATSGNVTTAFDATGIATFPLTETYTVPSSGGYFLALISVATTGGSVARAGVAGTGGAAGVGSGYALGGNVAGGGTDLGTSITLTATTNILWVGAS